jgi:glycine/D-amino acid oxidase-like deaminating enzyme
MSDAIVIGGGFYGAAIAIYLAKSRGFRDVVLVEREDALLQRASYNNQARVHNGYHYPRSFTTAFRSRVNLPRFVRDFPDAVKKDFTKLYAIARRNSKVTAKQFDRFCREIGASIEPAEPSLKGLFSEKLIEEVFLVQEHAFDSTRLAAWALRELAEAGVQVRYGTRVTSISNSATGPKVLCTAPSGSSELSASYVFNCTYSGLNQFTGDFAGTQTRLKHEITEMALVDMPPHLKGIGITVMDGPFFSMMPFPARGLHTLSHVRYTPHCQWTDAVGIDPYAKLASYHKESRAERMARDVARYMPSFTGFSIKDSLFEVKTILVKNEGDDGRPILFERHADIPGCYSILGGKIDNIYDALERLDLEPLLLPARAPTHTEAPTT